MAAFSANSSPISHLAIELLTEVWGAVPRQALSQILGVSKTWHDTATHIPSLWNTLDFGPHCTLDDLDVAQQWITRAQNRPLVVTVNVTRNSVLASLVPIFDLLAPPVCDQIQHFSVSAPESAVLDTYQYFTENTFGQLQSLSVLIATDLGHFAVNRPEAGSIIPTDSAFPHLTKVHFANMPFIFSAPFHLTELVLGAYSSDDVLIESILAVILPHFRSLSRLGLHQQMLNLPSPSSLIPHPAMSLPLLTHLSMRGVHMDSLARFIRLLDAPLLTELTLSVNRWDLRPEDSSEELTELLRDTSFTHRLTALNLQSLDPFANDNSFFRYFENIQTLRLNFRYEGLSPSFWDTLANPEHDGPTFLPNLQNLSLAGVPAGHAQELVYLRERVQQPRLKLLELVFFRAEDVLDARSPAWSTWLSSHVNTLVVPPFVERSAQLQSFHLF
ncbi:hypothetical protein DFH06DRAFT_1332118 [Mycena polygramma]|nr:hypothetical protein DFH06DRAFT_1332118 [Mycena polygramma]